MKNYLALIRLVIFIQACIAIFSSFVWWAKDDLDKWFSRWAFGLILFSAWGIMKHLSMIKNKE